MKYFERISTFHHKTTIATSIVGIIAGPFTIIHFWFPNATQTFRYNATLIFAVALFIAASIFGALIWLANSARKSKKIRFTLQGMMATVVFLGLGLGIIRWWLNYNFATRYSSNYSEDQFQRVRIDMTTIEVETILGRPIQQDSASQRWFPYENWIYSEPPPPGTIGDNYRRRWIMFDEGKVVAIVNDYYTD